PDATAIRFCLVEGQVRVLQHGGSVNRSVKANTRPGTHANQNFVFADLEGIGESLDQFARSGVSVCEIDKHWKQHCELIATQAANNSPVSHAFFEPVGHRNDEVVTYIMSEGVIDILEVVDIHQNDRPKAGVLFSLQMRVLKQFEEQPPVRKASQRIVFRHELDMRVLFAAFSNVE